MELTGRNFEPFTPKSILASTERHGNTRTKTHGRNDTVSQFLASRRALTEAGNADGVEKLDETLRDLATSGPDSALAIIKNLSASDDVKAREAATIYAQHLFPTRREQVADLLVSLLNDPNPDIARQALHTIDTLTQDPNLNADQAASRIVEMKSQAS